MADLRNTAAEDFSEESLDGDAKEVSAAAKKPAMTGAMIAVKLSRRIVLLTLVIGAILTAYIYRSVINLRGLRRLLARIDMGLDGGTVYDITFNGSSLNSFGIYQDDFVLLSEVGLKLFNETGRIGLDEQFLLREPVLRVSESYILAYSSGESKLRAFNALGPVWTYESEYPIESARVCGSGGIAIVTRRKGYRASVEVYSRNFELIYRRDSATRPITDAVLSADGKRLAIVGIDAEGGSLFSALTIAATDREEPLAAVEIPGELILSVTFAGANIRVLTDKSLLTLDGAGSIINRREYGGLRPELFAAENESLTAVVFRRYIEDSRATMWLVNEKGDIVADIAFAEEVLDVSVSGDTAAALDTHGVWIYGSDGSLLRREDVEPDIKRVILSDRYYVLAGANRALTGNLPAG